MSAIYGSLLGGMIGATGASIAGLLGQFTERLLGERGTVFLVGETDLERTRHFYERWGFARIAVGRVIGGPAEYLVVVAGLTRIPFRTVFLAILTGAYGSAFCMSFLGAWSLVEPWLAMGLAALLVLVLIGVFYLLQWHHKRQLAPQTDP